MNSTNNNITLESFMPLSSDTIESITIKETTPEERQELSDLAMDRLKILGDRVNKR